MALLPANQNLSIELISGAAFRMSSPFSDIVSRFRFADEITVFVRTQNFQYPILSMQLSSSFARAVPRQLTVYHSGGKWKYSIILRARQLAKGELLPDRRYASSDARKSSKYGWIYIARLRLDLMQNPMWVRPQQYKGIFISSVMVMLFLLISIIAAYFWLAPMRATVRVSNMVQTAQAASVHASCLHRRGKKTAARQPGGRRIYARRLDWMLRKNDGIINSMAMSLASLAHEGCG